MPRPHVGVRLDDPLEYQRFLDGFREMVWQLEPAAVLSHGPLPAACGELVEVVPYPTRWAGIRAARAGNRRRGQG